MNGVERTIGARIKSKIQTTSDGRVGTERIAVVDMPKTVFDWAVVKRLRSLDWVDSNRSAMKGKISTTLTVNQMRRYLGRNSETKVDRYLKAPRRYSHSLDIADLDSEGCIVLNYYKSTKKLQIRFAVNQYTIDGDRLNLV